MLSKLKYKHYNVLYAKIFYIFNYIFNAKYLCVFTRDK